MVSNLFKVKRKSPITLMWKEKDLDCNSNEGMIPLSDNVNDEQELEEEGTYIPPENGPLKTGGKRNAQPKNIGGSIATELVNTHEKRNRRKPVNRSSDFLWEN
jgi:hypothetical protein